MKPFGLPSLFESQGSNAELITDPAKSFLKSVFGLVLAEFVRDVDDDGLWHRDMSISRLMACRK